MANTIRIKRRITGATGAPASLAVGELAYNEMDDTLYIGKYNNNTPLVVAVAGSGEYLRLSNVSQTVAGTKTFSGGLLYSGTLNTSENSTQVATTAWVKSLNYSTTVGTVTSVALSLPAIFTVTGSPVTSSGTLTATLANQTTNLVFASPNGSTGTPTFRSLVAADIPTLTAAKISDFDTQVRTSRLNQMTAPNADVSMASFKITNLATPTLDSDAANKGYVDSVAQGLDPKQSVRAATTANIATLSGTMTIDGIALVAGDRILVKDQSTASQNGIYVVAASTWARANDSDTWAELISAYVFVEQGTVNADNGYLCTIDAGGTLGSTAVTFVQFTGAGQVIAGGGLTKSGNTLDVGGTTNRITVNADSIDIASTYVGQTSITTLGTIGTGTWDATTIATNRGGTGLTSFTSGGAVYATSTSALTTGTLPTASGGTGLTAFTSGGAVYATSTSALTTGTLPIASGGTAKTSFTTNGIVYGNNTSALGVTAAGTWDSTNSIGQILSHNSSGVPVWTDTIDGGTF
jgi:hypothetical protein